MDKQTARKLCEAAIQGAKNAFTGTNKPDDFRCGAAVLTSNGNIYSSGQYFSDTHSLTLRAEQAALVHAAAHGEYGILAITVTGNDNTGNGKNIYPCHMCKQLLWETHLRSKHEMEIILCDFSGKAIEKLKISKIMSHAWPAKD